MSKKRECFIFLIFLTFSLLFSFFFIKGEYTQAIRNASLISYRIFENGVDTIALTYDYIPLENSTDQCYGVWSCSALECNTKKDNRNIEWIAVSPRNINYPCVETGDDVVNDVESDSDFSIVIKWKNASYIGLAVCGVIATVAKIISLSSTEEQKYELVEDAESIKERPIKRFWKKHKRNILKLIGCLILAALFLLSKIATLIMVYRSDKYVEKQQQNRGENLPPFLTDLGDEYFDLFAAVYVFESVLATWHLVIGNLYPNLHI